MPSVQLERLRPQINAITSQYEDSELFIKSLIALLKSYSGEIDESSSQISPYSIIPRMNIPQVVLNQLEISLKHLAHKFPDQTKIIAENLWEQNYFEIKEIAIILISNLPAKENNYYFEKIEAWVDEEIEQPIINSIFEKTNKIVEMAQDTQWMLLIETWLSSKIERMQKIGLIALTNRIRLDTQKNLPVVFRLVEPLLSDPHVSINNDLLKLVGSLISASEPETAAFLIHLAAIYPKPEIFSFIRKCLPLFDQYFASEIKKLLTIL
jgi:hypothetical protein